MSKTTLNPEVFRAAAKLLHRRRKWYSCHAIETAVMNEGEWRTHPYKDAYAAMFGPADWARMCMRGMDVKQKYIRAVVKEPVQYDSQHPFWNGYKRTKGNTLRQQRIMALLMMADLVEAGATF